MLTRLEVDGFKNLLGFSANFGPFTCIAGPNGAGKSNIFDAIVFLSLLADHEIMQAASLVRSAGGQGGDPLRLFWTDGERRARRMRFAAEMLVSRDIRDDFGREAKATTTFLRYELEFEYEAPSGLGSLGRLVLAHEGLTYIPRAEAGKHLPWPHSKRNFRDKVIQGNRHGKAFVSTVTEGGATTIKIHQDGGSRGPARPAPAHSAPRTILCTTTTASDPTILAARREIQQWRLLALEPSAMRSPDKFAVYSTHPFISTNGAHLPATLYRQAHREAGEGDTPGDHGKTAARVYADIANKLARLVSATALRVDRDDRQELLTLELQLGRNGPFFPARSLSDGTLRFLALCILDNDPAAQGLLCMEEPENGIHPERMPAMVDLVRGLAVDAEREPGEDNPLRQVIVNTHSPAFVRLQNKQDLLFAKTATVPLAPTRWVNLVEPGSSRVRHPVTAHALRLLPLTKTWRETEDNPGVSLGEILGYLTAPPGTQISLEPD